MILPRTVTATPDPTVGHTYYRTSFAHFCTSSPTALHTQGGYSFKYVELVSAHTKRRNRMTAQPDSAPQIVELPIAQLKLRQEYQVRMSTDQDTCQLYRDNMLDGAEFPPLEAVKISGTDDIYLVDGRHRHQALLMLGKSTAMVKLSEGSKSYALYRACVANAHHPRQMNIADKKNAVEMLLLDPEFNDPDVWSDRRLALAVGVSHTLVGKLRELLYPAIHQEREAAREARRQEQEASVPARPSLSFLDHAEAPAGLPEPIEVGPRVNRDWRQNRPARLRMAAGGGHSNGMRPARVATLPPAQAAPFPNHNAVPELPIGSAITRRLKGHKIFLAWRELDEEGRASLLDLDDVPDDVLALAYQSIGEEIRRRLARA
jgi:hypothetical protein